VMNLRLIPSHVLADVCTITNILTANIEGNMMRACRELSFLSAGFRHYTILARWNSRLPWLRTC
jgi:hypothetical protein